MFSVGVPAQKESKMEKGNPRLRQCTGIDLQTIFSLLLNGLEPSRESTLGSIKNCWSFYFCFFLYFLFFTITIFVILLSFSLSILSSAFLFIRYRSLLQ